MHIRCDESDGAMNLSPSPEVVGVVGTLAGTVLGWALNSISRRGTLHVYVTRWKNTFFYNNKWGEFVSAPSFSSSESYDYALDLDVYNSSATTLIMRDIHIEFMSSSDEVLYSEVPDDASTRHGDRFIQYDKLEIANIPAKSVVTLHVHGGCWKSDKCDDFLWLAEVTCVRLVYRDQHDWRRRLEVTRIAPLAFFDEKKSST